MNTTWIEAAGVALLVLGLLYIPGGLMGWCGGIRGLALLALGPAMSLAVYGVGAIVAGLAGWRWGLGPAAGVLAISCALAYLCGRLWPIVAPRALPVWGRRAWGGVALAGLAGLVMTLVPILIGMGRPAAIAQRWDAVFHANLVQWMRQTGDASTLDAGLLTDPSATHAYYPAGWHDLTALLPHVIPVEVAVNVSILVCSAVPWVVSCIYLARVLLPANPAYAVAAGIMAGVYQGQAAAMPVQALHPNAVATALLPALLAWTVQFARVVTIHQVGRATRLVVLAVSLLGGALAHPNILFSYLLVAAPAATYITLTVMRRMWRRGRRVLAIVGLTGVIAIFVAGAWLVMTRPAFQSVTEFTQSARHSTPVAFLTGLIDTTASLHWGPNIAVAILLVLGIWVILATGRRRWLLVSLGLTDVVYAAAAGNWAWAKVLSGPWYNDPTRLGPVVAVVGVPICSIGAVRLTRYLRAAWDANHRASAPVGTASGTAEQAAAVDPAAFSSPPSRAASLPAVPLGGWRTGVAWVLAVAVVLGAGSQVVMRVAPARATFVASPLKFMGPQEEEFAYGLADILDPNGVLLGDPFNGSALVYALSGQPTVFKHLVGSWSDDQWYVARHFTSLGSDPELCAALNRLGVEYFYYDPIRWDNRLQYPALSLGVADLPGLQEVTRSGDVVVYRITACGG